MKILLNIFPVALLVAYSQLIVKWRALHIETSNIKGTGFIARITAYFSDPLLLSAYAAALLASVIWLFVVAELPLAIAFPIYIGITFILILCGSWFFLLEDISGMRIFAALLILSGIALGVKN